MKDVAAIITKHVEACVIEIRDAVRVEMLAALQPEVVAAPPKSPRKQRRRKPVAKRSRAKPRVAAKPTKRSPPRRIARAASIPPTAVSRVTKAQPRVAVTPATSKAKPAPIVPKQHVCSECDKPGHNARTCPDRVRAPLESPPAPNVGTGIDSPRVKAPVDAARSSRFDAIEASAQKRTGSLPSPRSSATF